MSHYDWLDQHFESFCGKIGIPYSGSMGSSHGDKCYTYRERWEKEGIPFAHGVALYLLTYLRPFDKEVRETETGWVAPVDWVIQKYPTLKHHFETL